MHGGASPRARLAAAVRVEEARIRQAVARFGVEVSEIEHPLIELQRLAVEAVGWKEQLAEMVEQMHAYADRTGQPHAHVVLYERALDRTASILATIAKLGIDERLARLNERQGAEVASVFRRAIEAAGLPPELRARLEAALVAEIRAVMASSTRMIEGRAE